MKKLLVLALVLGCVPVASADDWPQWMGPKRDNVWRETGLLEKFPKGGPKVLWRTPIEYGYAGPAISNGKVFLMDFVTDAKIYASNFGRRKFSGKERVLCLSEKTGKILWKHEYPVTYAISYPCGPRCTPTVEGDKVYFLGAMGNLFCYTTKGKKVWSKDLRKEYKTTAALWGYASHPLIYGDTLICVVGGEGTHTVAFNKDTGKQVWASLNSKAQGYSPPTIIKANGIEQLIITRPDAVSSVNPKTGKEYWSVPYRATSGSIIMSPVKYKNYLYVAGYNNQNMLVKMSKKKLEAEVMWKQNRQGFSPVNVQPFLVDDVLYGIDQSGTMYALKLPEGKRLWKSAEYMGKRGRRGSGTAFLVKQGDRFWIFNEAGELVIAKLSPKGFEEIDRAKVIEPTNTAADRKVVWTAPAFANKHMYVRNDKEIICVDLSK